MKNSMKNRNLKKIFTLTFAIQLFSMAIFISASSQAAPLKIIFFYPGGQGSQEEAQPILDQFAEGIQKASEGKISAKVTYLADKQKGLEFIQSQKPQGGIISYDLFLEHQKDWNLKNIAQSLQLPSADGNNQYFLIKAKGQKLDASQPLKVYSSQELSKDFVKTKLFSELHQEIDLQRSQNVLGKLRKLGMGEIKDEVILLDQFEYHNISRLKIAWASNIEIMQQSVSIPSAPFVVFNENITPEVTEQLKAALVKLSKDSSMKETLQLLRLKGFQ